MSLLQIVSSCALVLITFLALASRQQVSAEVDSSAPDLTMFKLRKVDAKKEARRRASQPITDLESGALHLRESLFVDEQEIVCASYANLFDIIKGLAGQNNKVRQDTVESLAVVVAWDKEFYLDLFAKESAGGESSQVGEHFLEAANRLEGQENQKARDTWAQLVGCMSKFLAAKNKQVADYLSDPNRSEQVASLEKFNAVPTAIASDSKQTPRVKVNPNGLVHHLARKIDGEGPPGRHLFGRMVTDEAYNRSRRVVDSVEPERVLAARRQFGEKPSAVEDVDGSSSAAKVSSLELNRVVAAKADKEKEKEKRLFKFSKKDEPREVDLVVVAGEEPEQDKYFSSFNENQLAVLEFVRMRLDGQPAEASVAGGESLGPRLSMQLALDFQSHWEDLEQARLDPTTEFGKRAIGFLEDEQSQQLARRVDRAIRQYVKLISLLAEMKIQEDRLKSFDPLQVYLERLTELLNALDDAFDVDEVRRMHAIWKAKYVEYRTLERFINSDSAFGF